MSGTFLPVDPSRAAAAIKYAAIPIHDGREIVPGVGHDSSRANE